MFKYLAQVFDHVYYMTIHIFSLRISIPVSGSQKGYMRQVYVLDDLLSFQVVAHIAHVFAGGYGLSLLKSMLKFHDFKIVLPSSE